MKNIRTYKRILSIATAALLSITTVGFNGVTASAESATYTITIPSTLDVKNTGWNPLKGGIGVEVNGNIDEGELTVKAISKNNLIL